MKHGKTFMVAAMDLFIYFFGGIYLVFWFGFGCSVRRPCCILGCEFEMFDILSHWRFWYSSPLCSSWCLVWVEDCGLAPFKCRSAAVSEHSSCSWLLLASLFWFWASVFTGAFGFWCLKLGMSSATETLCGQAFGASQYHMMGIYLQRSWIVNIATATILVPVFVFTTPILRLLGQEEDIAIVAGNIALWFLPILYYYVFSMTIQMYLQAQLKNMIIGWLSTSSFLLHVLLSWIFVIKLNLGIPGAMGSMIISCWLLIVGEFVYIFGGWCPNTWRGFTKAAFYDILPVVKLSVSSGVMLCLEMWYNSILVLLAGYMTNAEIAISAFSICLNISTWEFMICIGFLGAACVRVSNELGRGNPKAAKFSIKVILSTSICMGIFFFILCLVFSNKISYLFTSNEKVAETVSSLSVLLAFSMLLNSIQPVLTGVVIGAGRQSLVAFINLGCYYLIGIPIGVLLGYVAHLQVKGIWIGMLCGMVLQTLVVMYITWRTDWDDQVIRASERLNQWSLRSVETN